MLRLCGPLLFLIAVVLFFTAILVFFGAVAGGRVLELPDPLLAMSARKVLYLVGASLLGVSAFLLMSRNAQLRLGVLSWLSCNLAVYHFGAMYNGSANLWACLGNLSPLVSLAPRTSSLIVSILLVCLFTASSGLLILDWWVGRNARKLKMPQLSCASPDHHETASVK
jgi:hypothetical protein